MEIKTNSYNTESHALAKTITTSCKAFLFNNYQSDEDVKITSKDYNAFIRCAMFDYIINAAENILSDSGLVEKGYIKDSSGIMRKIVTPPTGEQEYWTITLTYENLLEFMTGNDKAQNRIVKDLILKAWTHNDDDDDDDEKKKYFVKKQYILNPYDTTKWGLITPFDVNVYMKKAKPLPQLESLKKFEKKSNEPQTVQKITRITKSKSISQNLEFDYIKLSVHDWVIQGMQNKTLKKENEKKIRFFSIPKNLFPCYVRVENYFSKKDTKKIGRKHINAHFFIEIYRYISIHDTNINYTEKQNEDNRDVIKLNLKDFVLNLKAKIAQVYKNSISIRKQEENTQEIINSLNFFCVYTMIIASKYNYGFYGANFLPYYAKLDNDNILIYVYRPSKNKKFNPETFKEVKKLMKETELEAKQK